MLIPDSKKSASLIVASLKPKTGEMEEERMSHEDSQAQDNDREGLKAVAREAMDALKADDEHAFAMALHDFFEMCSSMPEAASEDESEEE